MKLGTLLSHWRPGSYDAPWSWADEREDLEFHLSGLLPSVERDGITTPVLLGNDGRVWDGHHRIVVAMLLGIEDVPVVVA